jgi:hypothetical protein
MAEMSAEKGQDPFVASRLSDDSLRKRPDTFPHLSLRLHVNEHDL